MPDFKKYVSSFEGNEKLLIPYLVNLEKRDRASAIQHLKEKGFSNLARQFEEFLGKKQKGLYNSIFDNIDI